MERGTDPSPPEMASPEQPEEVPITVSVEPPLSRLPSIVLPALEKIIKSASWRNSKLASQCNSLIESFPSPTTAPSSVPGLFSDDYSLSDTEKILSPLLSALASANSKLADPAIDCLQKLISHGILCGDADVDGESDPNSKLLAQVIDSICSCATEYSDDVIELLVLKTLLSAITSTSIRIHGDCLLRIVRTCYDVYLGSKNDVNQTTAKASLIQMLVIVFRRMEADSSTVPLQPIVVAELMEPTVLDKGGGGVDLNMIQFVQGFITKVISDIDVVLNPGTPVGKSRHDGAFQSTAVETTNPADLLDSTDKDMLDAKYWEISMYKTALEGRKGELGEDGEGEGGDMDKDLEVQIGSKLRRDAFLVFRALSKLSMKSPPKEALGDPAQMRGKIVALELLKILLENAGSVFRTSDRFLGAIKQYLCLSLLKNSASPFLIIFQLSCSIFISLVSRFRSGLKAEIGVFFPMIVLRVLENVAQPNFQQKMIVLRFVEKLCVDSHILVDVFINYDCDVDSANIFERMVTGLLKTAQGVSPGVVTTLLPDEQATMKLEAMKCLVEIMKSMGDWMNKQLRIPDPSFLQKVEVLEDNRNGREIHIVNDNNDDTTEGFESQSDSANGFSDAVSIEQRRAYKLELQEGISLFNRKPKKGIDFLVITKKVGGSPEEIASFLRNASGLNKTLIGDYLGEREELSLKVMHAYVDSFDFQAMEFDESIRVFLQGFRLPGEAQKIDRIMEKFAERYCKCNAHVFSSADTAYVLAYSVILLNTDAHNPMVKNKMSVDDFIRNNRGIDDGKDLPEEYMRSLYERILRNEIKMKEDDLTPQHSRSMNSNAILGLDSILNIVIQKRGEEKSMVTSDGLIRRMQEQFKEKARKSESPYYPATDVVTLRFMIEVCWAPMLAAFSVPLEQSYDEVVISLCLDGFRHAIHVTAVMAMKTHRDAFVTSLAKFTSLHSVADIKQRNIDAIKAIVAIADEDGNYLQDAWEHILTCVSRFEHLYLLGEGVLPDAAFFALPETDIDNSKQEKSAFLPVLKDKGVGHIHHPAAAVRRGSYDSAGVGGHASGLVTSEQVFNLVSKFNMLEQVGPSEMNRIFTRSQKLNSEGVIDFVKALCKVSMEELRSSSEPRVFSLTKIVEIAHYNMDRIRLVWSSIWHVLSDFFVAIGCSENLSIAIFAMDSLRQLAMKFLEREELANYNFQNEFMKPFVIVMRKSRAVEIRELIIRCVSQMVLTRVDHVKSGWKSMFMVFSTASYDEHRNVVMLAFEIIERIVKDYFPYITETETTTFTDFVNCLIAFANSRFNKDVSLNAIAFLRICAVKLAEGEVGNVKNKDKETTGNFSQISDLENNGKLDIQQFSYKDDHLYLWFPLLVGLSELTFDLRLEIRKSALDVLFETLRHHGHLFSLSLWKRVFDSVLFPIFDYVRHAIDPAGESHAQGPDVYVNEDQDAWLYDTCTLALQLVVDLFAIFYDTVNPLLKKVLMLLGSFIKRSHQGLAGIGIAALVRLMSNAGSLFSDDNWLEVIHSLEEAVLATVPNFSHVVDSSPEPSGSDTVEEDMQKERSRMLYSAIADAKCHAAVQLLLIQAVMEIYSMYRLQLTTENTISLFQILHGVASHAQKINSDENLRSKLQELGSMTQMQDPPLLRLETESYQICIALLQNLIIDQTASNGDSEITGKFVDLCKEILLLYLQTAQTGLPADPVPCTQSDFPMLVPLGSAKRKELAARAPVLVATLQAISGLEASIFRRNLTHFFPLLSDLISCEHGSNEVQIALSDMLSTCVGPVLLRSC